MYIKHLQYMFVSSLGLGIDNTFQASDLLVKFRASNCNNFARGLQDC